MGLWEVEPTAGFDDVVALAAACRFSDCRHATEPGCAVLRALGDGSLPSDRWQSYRQQEQKIQDAQARARPEPVGRQRRR